MRYNVFEAFQRQKDMFDHTLLTKIAEYESVEEAMYDIDRRIAKSPMGYKATTRFSSKNNAGTFNVSIRVMIQADPIISYGWYIIPVHDDLGDHEYKIGDTYTFSEPSLEDGRWPDDEEDSSIEEEEYFK